MGGTMVRKKGGNCSKWILTETISTYSSRTKHYLVRSNWCAFVAFLSRTNISELCFICTTSIHILIAKLRCRGLREELNSLWRWRAQAEHRICGMISQLTCWAQLLSWRSPTWVRSDRSLRSQSATAFDETDERSRYYLSTVWPRGNMVGTPKNIWDRYA